LPEPVAITIRRGFEHSSVLGCLRVELHLAPASAPFHFASASVKAEPPVPIKQTIKLDYIISLEDGRRYKSMKRHLSSRGITPEQYREKWGLRPDYPMVAPNYSKARSELAKSLGLGQGYQEAREEARGGLIIGCETERRKDEQPFGAA
jgi:predicted transcriptional regulator